MKKAATSVASLVTLASVIGLSPFIAAEVQDSKPFSVIAPETSRNAAQEPSNPGSAQYQALQKRLSTGWNTWDVHSVATEVLLPDGLAIHAGLKHNSTLYGDAFLGDALIGRLTPDAEQVFPGPHSWEGSYTSLRLSWKGHNLRLQTAHDGSNLVMLATPLPSQPLSALPATIVFSVNYLWGRPGTVIRGAKGSRHAVRSMQSRSIAPVRTHGCRERLAQRKKM